MAKQKENTSKPRAKKYDPKVSFEGSLEDMIQIAIKPIHNKKLEIINPPDKSKNQ